MRILSALPDDLRRGQVPLQTHHAGQAKAAREAAADLRGDAQRGPVVVGHHHRADPAPALEREDQLLTSVLRRSQPLGLGDLDDGTLAELRAEVLWQVGHRLEVEDGLAKDPRRELAPAIARGAELDGEVFELGGQAPDEIHARHCGKKDITAIAARFASG